MPLKRGYRSATSLPGIHENDDETDDIEVQAESSPSDDHHAQQLRRVSSAPMGSRRRLSTGLRRQASINDFLNQTVSNNDEDRPTTPIKYRDYLRAERNLKAAAMHSQHPPLSSPGTPHAQSPRSPRHRRLVLSGVSAAVGSSDFFSLASHSDRQVGLDDSDKYEPANGDSEEAKQRRRERERDEAYRKNVHNLAHRGRRASIMAGDTKLWETLMDTDEDMELEEEVMRSGELNDEEDVVHDHHQDNDGVVPWYSPPMQRVFYGKPQVLPHVNWGDLFLDLFFVAAAYNLGVLLISSMNDSDWLRGLLHLLAIFGALYRTWFNDLTFSSRYTVLDHCHRLIWGIKFFSIGVAIIFITPLNLMGKPESIDTSAFIFAILVESLITFGLNLEIYFKAIGDRTPIKSHSRRMILHEDLPTIFFYAVAFVLAMLSYYHIDIYGNSSYSKEDGYGRMLAGASDIDCSSGGRLLLSRILGASEVGCPSDGYRKLAPVEAGDGCTCHTGIKFSTDDIPMAIVYFSYCFHNVFLFLKKLALASSEKDIRDRFVPNNLDYVIHRYGEWIMLMIGEGILSLLIVETTESVEYFVVSCLGVMTVMGIHVLVFESQPSTSDGHAIYRSLRAQMIFGLLVQLLSLGLIAFGVSFKIMLTTIVSNEAKYDSYESRRLAATPSVSEEATSALFSASLAIVLISLEFMLANHKGAKGTYKRLFKSRDDGEYGIVNYVNKPLVVLTLFKVGLIAFTATLSQWKKSLTELSIIAFSIIVAMSISRIIGWGLVHKEDEIRQMLQTLRGAPGSLTSSVSYFRRTVSVELANLFNKPESSTFKPPPEEIDDLRVNKEIWDTSFECIIAFNRDGRLEYVNKTALVEFGYNLPSEILGYDVSILFGGTEDKDDPLQLKKLGDSSFPPKILGQHQDGKKGILHAKRKDGTVFACMVGLKPVIDTDLISGYIKNSSNLSGLENITMEGFIAASARGDENEIKRMLLDSKIQIDEGDYDKRTALHLASDNGHANVVRLLCEAHADVNVKDRFGNRPLDCAIEGHHTECIQILTTYGAKRGKGGQLSQLMEAAKQGDSYEIKILIDQGGVDVNGTCSIGRTALHVAVAQGSEAIAELLCEAGANVNAEDNDKNRPMDLVDGEKYPGLKPLLQKYGATSSRPPTKQVSFRKTTTSGDDFFEDAFDAIIICKSHGLIQKLNNTAVELLGYTSKEELVNMTISLVCPSIDADSNNQAITKARRKDGSEFLCMVVSKENQHNRLITWWIRDMSAFDQMGIGLVGSDNKGGHLQAAEEEYKA